MRFGRAMAGMTVAWSYRTPYRFVGDGGTRMGVRRLIAQGSRWSAGRQRGGAAGLQECATSVQAEQHVDPVRCTALPQRGRPASGLGTQRACARKRQAEPADGDELPRIAVSRWV